MKMNGDLDVLEKYIQSLDHSSTACKMIGSNKNVFVLLRLKHAKALVWCFETLELYIRSTGQKQRMCK